MDWFTGGGGGDGWEDDDDLADLSDQSLEDAGVESEDEPRQPQAQQPQGPPQQRMIPPPPPPPPRPSPPQESTGTVALGGGMFMGRLTRFLEAVTQPGSSHPDEDEEDGDYDDDGDGEGWAEEDDGLADLEDEDDNDYHDDQQEFTDTLNDTVETTQAVAVPVDGWDTNDDDIDLDFSFESPPPEDQQQRSKQQQQQPKDPSDLEARDTLSSRNVSFGDLPDPAVGGIVVQETMPVSSHQLSSLSSLALTERTIGNDSTPPGTIGLTQARSTIISRETMPSPSRQMSSLSDPAKSERSVANSTSSGWDDEDIDLNTSNNDDTDLDPNISTTMVDHTPPPRPPVDLSPSRATSMTHQTQSVSLAEASGIAVASTSIVEDGWDDDDVDDVLINDMDPMQPPSPRNQPTVMIDHIPPPPPVPVQGDAVSQAVSFAARSTGAVAASTASGWDEDDDALDDLDVEGNQDNNIEEEKVVDITPPPPLPHDTKNAVSSLAIALPQEDNDGWDEEDDDLGDLDGELPLEEEGMTSLQLVDHTPPPPPPAQLGRQVGHDNKTDVAILDEDDDISRDDTLSIANSRARYEELSLQPQGPPVVDQIPKSLMPVALRRAETTDAIKSNNSVASSSSEEFRPAADTASGSAEDLTPPQQPIVDHTPSIQSSTQLNRLERYSTSEDSMMVLSGDLHANSSVAESWDSLSDRVSEVRPRNRRMVDHTPSGSRFHRGLPVDTSLAVAGHTSVGESLDSIYEEGEEPDSPDQANPSTPMAIEAGWGDPNRQPGDEFIININDIPGNNTTTIPYGAAMTPTAATGMGARIPPTTLESEEDNDEDEDDDDLPLVDHTPLPLVSKTSIAASIDVLSVSSEEGDLGESIVGIDDVKEDLYGQVVDHTPATPNLLERAKVGRVGLMLGSVVKQEDDTVVGVAENTDVEKDIKADDDMDDESSRGTKTTLEEYENRSLISSVRLVIPEEKQVVDHVPVDRKVVRRADASTVVFADASTASSQVGDDIANDDDTSPAGFGPIVDHTPSVHFRSARSVATSVVTQTSGLDVDLKDDEDLDNTVGPGASTEGDDGWEAEPHSLPPLVSEENHVVDHVPTRATRHMPPDGSMRVMVDAADDDITQIDTIAEDTVVDYGPIVDHTPFTAQSSTISVGASMLTVPPKTEDEIDNTTAVGASSTVGGDGWDNDIPDLEDMSAGEDQPLAGNQEEPTVVDHVPTHSFSRSANASVRVLVDPVDVASTVYDENSPGDTGGEGQFGPVVDHTPIPPASGANLSLEESMRVHTGDLGMPKHPQDEEDVEDGGTWFGASTIGGVSTVGASGDASSSEANSSRGEWEDDGDVLDEIGSPTTAPQRLHRNARHMVDHVPHTTTVNETDASIAVLVDPSVASSHEKEEVEDTIDVGTFGDVVDHTPSVTMASHYSVGNSMVTRATGLTTDIKRDDDMDETTWNGGGSAQDEGWDHEERELQELVDPDDDQMPPLVDHVPERPESRPTDASTFVAGDPSEIFSQVDDLGQDETHFGPVVDQLPLAQYSAHASGAGSTIVNIASVAEDDLDIAVEQAIDGEDLTREAQDQTGWQETLPNPQSGNDEDNQDREQVVDYVPDEQEEEIPDLVRDGSSEMATVGEKSTMLPADDPKEDEFGPVVDQLPITREEGSPSPISHPPVVSNGHNKRVGENGSMSGGPNIDSVAPNFSVASKTSKDDDGLEEDEFGPVVDHLPTGSSRASFTPSRGGSTVDALATVSEVDDDYVAGDGWEDDVDIDVGDHASPTSSNRPVEDRNLSVKWIDGINSKNTTGISAGTSEDYFDAEMGDSTRVPLNETRYYDPELGNTAAWGSLNSDDIEGDDTPPSTPRSSFESRRTVDIASSDANLAPMAISDVGGDCRICANSSAIDCPCIKRLLAANDGEGGMIGMLKTPDGGSVRVNFDKLLENEMTKRRLVEKEFQALRSTIESLKSSKDTLVLAGETQMDLLNKMKNSNVVLSKDLEAARAAATELQLQKNNSTSANKSLEEKLMALDEEKRKLEAQHLALKRDMEALQAQLAQKLSSASSDFHTRENELQTEISMWKTSNDELKHKIARFETECENLRGKNESLYEDLETYREAMSKLEQEKAAMLSKESALNVQINHLKTSLQKQNVISSGTFQTQITSLQAEVAARSHQCTDLASEVTSLQSKLMAAEAEKFKQTKELARLEKDRSNAVVEVENRVAKIKSKMEDALRMKIDEINHLRKQLDMEGQSIQRLTEEKVTLEKARQGDAKKHEQELAEKGRQISAFEQKLQVTSLKADSLEKEKEAIKIQIGKLIEASTVAEGKNTRIVEISEQLVFLKAALDDKDATISKMNVQIEDLNQHIQDIDSNWQDEIHKLRQERDRLHSELRSTNQRMSDATQHIARIVSEKERLDQMVHDLEARCRTMEEDAQEMSKAENASMSELRSELQQLRSTLRETDDRNNFLEKQKLEHASMYADLERQHAKIIAELDKGKSEHARLNGELRANERQMNVLKDELNRVQVDRQSLQLLYDELQSSLFESSNVQKSFAELTIEYNSVRHELMQAREICNQRDLQITALEKELAESRDMLVDKEHSITILRDENKTSQEGMEEMASTNRMLLSQLDALEVKIQQLESERDHVQNVVEQHENSLENLNAELDALTQQRDALLEERNMLEEENEEMLVQFGLFKEDMDKTDQELSALRADRTAWENAANGFEQELVEARKSLDSLKKSLKGEADEALAAMESVKNQLTHEKDALRAAMDELSKKNATLQEMLQNSEEQKQILLAQIDQLKQDIALTTVTSEASKTRLEETIEDLEGKNRALIDKSYLQEQTIVELQASLAQSQVISDEAAELRRRLSELEQTLADNERLLSQKDGALEDLNFRLANAGKAPVQSAELETLRRTVREMEESSERDRENIQELEQLSEEKTRTLKKTSEQLLSAERLVSQLRNDLEEKRQKEREIENLKERLIATEQRLERANQDASSFRLEANDLRSRVTSLQAELDDYRQAAHQPAKEPSGQSSAEMQSLRQQIEILKQQQITSSSQTGAREEVIEREVHLLQQQMRQKDGEISKLQLELQSLVSDLSNKHEELENKQQHVDKLSCELEDLRSRANKPPTTSHVLDLTTDEAENAEKMRSQIISLARALEHSEGRRAVTIERLETERKANAESLRRLTESVKRFYSTLSMGET